MSKTQAFHVISGGEQLRFMPTKEMSAGALLVATGISRRQAQRIFAEGRLRSAEQILHPADMLSAWEEVTLQLAVKPVQQLNPSTAEGFSLLVADAFFLAVDKPAGILVHGDGTGAPNLSERVAGYLHTQGYAVQPQAIQRLDVATTGLVIFSLTEEFQPAFDALVASNALHKRYLAVVSGDFPLRIHQIDAAIGRDRHDARRMRINPHGKEAHTRVHVLQRCNGLSLLELELLSGRRHQIRVHLASVGFPLLGDSLYGGAPHPDDLMLHAWREEFEHPVTQQHIKLETAFPKRFAKLGFTAS